MVADEQMDDDGKVKKYIFRACKELWCTAFKRSSASVQQLIKPNNGLPSSNSSELTVLNFYYSAFWSEMYTAVRGKMLEVQYDSDVSHSEVGMTKATKNVKHLQIPEEVVVGD